MSNGIVNNAGAGPNDLGTLAIVVLKARNLPDKHTFSKQDPYTAIEIASFKDKTKVDNRGGQHPVWDDEFRVAIRKDSKKISRTLKISCFAKEPKGDDLIGSAELDISETLAKLEFDDWVRLEREGAYKGEVYLEMTFFPAGPRQQPITRRPSKLHPNDRLSRPQQTPPRMSPYNSPSGRPSDLPPAGRPSTSPRTGYLTPPRDTEPPLPPIPIEEQVGAGSGLGLRPSARPNVVSGPQHRRPSDAQEREEGRSGRVPTILRPGGPGAKGRKRQTNGEVEDLIVTQPPPGSGGTYSSPYDPQLPPPRSTGSDAYGHGQPSSPSQSPTPFNQYQSQPTQMQPFPSDGYDSQQRSQSPYPPQQAIFQQQGDAQGQRRESAPSAYFPEPTVAIEGPSPNSAPPMQHSYSYPHTPSFPSGPSAYSANQGPPSAYMQPPQQSAYTQVPSPSPSSVPVHFPGAYEYEHQDRVDPERDARLAARYGSPMPLPPRSACHPASASASKPLVPPRPSESPQRSPEVQQHHHVPPRAYSTSPPPPTYSREDKGKAPAPAPSRTPEPTAYLEHERRALERARQEEEDADFARRLAAEEEKEGQRPPPSTESVHRPGYVPLSQSAGAKGKAPQSSVESDEDFARRLARELNEDVVSDIRRSASASTTSANGSGMPGGFT